MEWPTGTGIFPPVDIPAKTVRLIVVIFHAIVATLWSTRFSVTLSSNLPLKNKGVLWKPVGHAGAGGSFCAHVKRENRSAVSTCPRSKAIRGTTEGIR